MFSPSLAELTEFLADASDRRLVLIDGPSGAGKSTLAAELVELWNGPVTLVRMDDLYPGWQGLAAASIQVATMVDDYRRQDATGWRRWDWINGIPAEYVPVRLDRDLIVEGCGAVSALSAPHADAAIWVTATDAVRKPRALERDRGYFDDYWQLWDDQFVEFIRRENPRSRCHVTIDTTSEPAVTTWARRMDVD